MRWGVLSDVHSNLEALEAVLGRLEAAGAEGYVACGDLVGYGADPDAVVSRVAALPNLKAVHGNHDLAVLGRMDLEWFNEYAREAVLWTRGRLGAKARAFLESLPERVETADFTVVHGSPRQPAEEYLLSSEQFLANLKHFSVSPCFIGHSHLPVRFAAAAGGRVDEARMREGEAYRLPDAACMLNPGSVGQPRDREPKASCGLYDAGKREFTLLRVAYPVAEAQKKIRAAGLPAFLAERLQFGE